MPKTNDRLYVSVSCAKCGTGSLDVLEQGLIATEMVRPEMLNERWALWFLERLRKLQAGEHRCVGVEPTATVTP